MGSPAACRERQSQREWGVEGWGSRVLGCFCLSPEAEKTPMGLRGCDTKTICVRKDRAKEKKVEQKPPQKKFGSTHLTLYRQRQSLKFFSGHLRHGSHVFLHAAGSRARGWPLDGDRRTAAANLCVRKYTTGGRLQLAAVMSVAMLVMLMALCPPRKDRTGRSSISSCAIDVSASS